MTAGHASTEAIAASLASRPGADTLVGGRYEMLGETTRPGGFAAYKARHVLLDSLVLLTALPDEVASDAHRLARVRAAVRAARWLRHEHIVPVFDLIDDGGRFFVVEPFVRGVPLERVIASRPLDAADALHVGRQLADALAYAHAADVVHGTVCPANILIENGTPPRVWLSGFVLSAFAAPRSPIATTVLPYAAPERLAGQTLDARADVYAVGLVLFELFERKPFFPGARDAIETALRDGKEPLLPRFSRVVPAGFAALVARTIRRSPAERQQEMAHVRADLHACLRSLAEPPAEPPAAPEAPRSTSPGRKAEVCVDRAARSARPAAPIRRTPARSVRRDPPATKWQPPPAAPARARIAVRPAWPVRERREATFPSRILVRAETPRRTPLAGKLFMGGALLALGWALLPLVTTSLDAPVALPLAPEVSASHVAAEGPAEEPVGVSLEPPRIEGREPAADRVALAAGQTTTFRIVAADGLSYAWWLDGREVGNEPEWRLVAPPQSHAATHRVEVHVSDLAGLEASKVGWTVEVSPRPPRPAPRVERTRRARGSTPRAR